VEKYRGLAWKLVQELSGNVRCLTQNALSSLGPSPGTGTGSEWVLKPTSHTLNASNSAWHS